MKKKVPFGSKNQNTNKTQKAENWVKSGDSEKIETTRYTIDLPVELHARIKYQCALKKVSMKDEIQKILDKHFT